MELGRISQVLYGLFSHFVYNYVDLVGFYVDFLQHDPDFRTIFFISANSLDRQTLVMAL